MRQCYVYILANRSRRLYIGVTNNLVRRIWRHRNGDSDFTGRYRITRLVYYEITADVMSAISREKQLKGWLRRKKVALITTSNPTWDDLAADWLPETTEKADPSSLRSSG